MGGTSKRVNGETIARRSALLMIAIVWNPLVPCLLVSLGRGGGRPVALLYAGGVAVLVAGVFVVAIVAIRRRDGRLTGWGYLLLGWVPAVLWLVLVLWGALFPAG